MIEKVAIRDFLYLDWERVRSIAAQLFRGVPEGVREETGSDSSKSGQLAGGIPGFLKGEATEDRRFFRSDNETRSFHHYVYTLVESQLTSRHLATTVDSSFSDWSPERFFDGQFVRIEGLLRLMDYGWMAAMMEALPAMLGTAHNLEGAGLKSRVTSGEVDARELASKRREQNEQLAGLKAFKLDELAGLMRQLYGDAVRIKIVPNRDQPQKVFVGSGKLANFSETSSSLAQKYGFEVDAGWIALGQINLSRSQSDPVAIPTGNQMEDAFEQMALILNGLMRIASSVTFPALSFTPISIYRVTES